MIERDPAQQKMYEGVRILRAAIRLKHSIAADRELNEVLPEFEKKFIIALQKGQVPETVDAQAIAAAIVKRMGTK